MLINKKRIKNLDKYTKGLEEGQDVVLVAPLNQVDVNRAIEIGFSENFAPGETVLPAIVGPITEFNSDGQYIIHKDQPMETAYRQQEWKWTEFRGRYDTVEKSKIVDIPYQRYPRTFIEPPALELSIATHNDGTKLIVSAFLAYTRENERKLLHAINMFLEAFSFCEIRNKNLESIIRAPIRKLHWDVLPQGKRPWSELKQFIEKLRESTTDGNKAVIDKRFESINLHDPEFVALGKAGFYGYLIFGFPEKNLYILESNQTNNATYIFEENWEHLSTLTKAEILNGNLHKKRVMHRESWFNEVNKLLSHR
ncbi:hypothetical protein [Methylobacter sp. BlB1]|uniref:hypothetical protein n=1 Tax=Methylobacter sp. BlB1 TaxID=2785914 RepID=UPI001893E062|nr:hypothetical protein [Methylobacter sp. BlB1]MBF6647170.1 hypothetical protein [Methylobacter sp. BlB1]